MACLPGDVHRQCPDDLAQGRADEVVDVGGCRLVVEHRHDQTECLGLGERHRRQPRPCFEPVPAVGTPGRLDGDARLAEDADVTTGGPLGYTQPLGEVVGRAAGPGLEDLQGTQRSRGGADVACRTGRLSGYLLNQKQIVRNGL